MTPEETSHSERESNIVQPAGLLAVAVTGVMNTFSDRETLTAGKLNTNFNSLKAAIESLPNWTKSGTTAVYNDGNVTIN